MKKVLTVSAISVIVTVLFSGIAGIFLGRWLTRERASVTMVSITKGREAGTRIEMPDIVVDLSKDFPWAHTLDKYSSPEDATEFYEACEYIIKVAPSVLKTIQDVRRDLPRVSGTEEKEELLYKILENDTLCSAIEGSLVRREFHLTRSRDSKSGPKGRENLLFEISHSTSRAGSPKIIMTFPHHVAQYILAKTDVEFRRESFEDFLSAMQRFDTEAIMQCMGVAEQTFEKDSLRAHAVVSALDNVFAHDPFEIEAVAVNNGDRVAVLNPYGVLVTEGGSKKVPPATLRVMKVIENADREYGVSETSPTYISLEPQSTKRLIFISEKLDKNSQLKSAYDSGILRCSVAILQQRRKGKRPKRVQSAWKNFGVGLKEELKSEAISSVRD